MKDREVLVCDVDKVMADCRHINSNTTLVKVKYLWDLLNLLCLVYSNTTLVKVKFRVEKPAEGSQNNSNTTLVKVKFIYLKNFINFFLFKYNTC